RVRAQGALRADRHRRRARARARREPEGAIVRRVIFTAFPGCEILDLAGPLQAFDEANGLGGAYAIGTRAATESVTTAQGVRLAGLPPLGPVAAGDLVIVPGFRLGPRPGAPRPMLALVRWLREA